MNQAALSRSKAPMHPLRTRASHWKHLALGSRRASRAALIHLRPPTPVTAGTMCSPQLRREAAWAAPIANRCLQCPALVPRLNITHLEPRTPATTRSPCSSTRPGPNLLSPSSGVLPSPPHRRRSRT